MRFYYLELVEWFKTISIVGLAVLFIISPFVILFLGGTWFGMWYKADSIFKGELVCKSVYNTNGDLLECRAPGNKFLLWDE